MDDHAKRREFEDFLLRELPCVNVHVILDYILATLDDEEFDIDEFIEMVSEYLPEFSTIDHESLSEWVAKIKTTSVAITEIKDFSKKSHARKNNLENDNSKLFEDAAFKELCTMFPSLDLTTIELVWSKFGRNIDTCVSELLEISNKERVPKPKENKEINKDYIMSRYAYVEAKETRTVVLPKEEPKKLVRYRDNQVVSTKGERYTMPKTAESEEMKKTYVNLKPLRKYRFH